MMNIDKTIKEKLADALNPSYMQVINESHMHNVPANSETHFKVVLVCDSFAGKRSVARHQLVYKLLAEELAGPVHALALHTYTPDEWRKNNASAPASPDCMGANG